MSEYLPLTEGQSVCVHRGSLTRTTGHIGIALARQRLLGLRLQLVRVLGDGGHDVVEHAPGIDFILVCAVFAGVLARVLDVVDVGHGWDGLAGRWDLWGSVQRVEDPDVPRRWSASAGRSTAKNHDAVWTPYGVVSSLSRGASI